MKRFYLKCEYVPEDRIPKLLEENHILINNYAKEYFSHHKFFAGDPGDISVVVASLKEIGFENGATLGEIFQRIPDLGLKPCPPCTGLFLRMAWKDQPESNNSVLSGTHSSPDRAVNVLSEVLEQNDDYPKGLYLRNVDGVLWLRGYICDFSYKFPEDTLFAFESCAD